jgi:hypothetical protein
VADDVDVAIFTILASSDPFESQIDLRGGSSTTKNRNLYPPSL